MAAPAKIKRVIVAILVAAMWPCTAQASAIDGKTWRNLYNHNADGATYYVAGFVSGVQWALAARGVAEKDLVCAVSPASLASLTADSILIAKTAEDLPVEYAIIEAIMKVCPDLGERLPRRVPPGR